jgi:hypothetical protein
MANCDFSLSQIMVYTGEDLDIELKLAKLGSTSNEEQKFTLVGAISSLPFSSTYNRKHSPCNATPSCPMPSLMMVFPRSTRLSIANGKLEGFHKKPMIQSNKIVADMNVEKKYVNSPVNNPTTCSIARKGVQDPSTILKTSMVICFLYIIIQMFSILVCLWGCNLIISMVRKLQRVN